MTLQAPVLFWFVIELLLLAIVCLPARASEQGNVIGSVRIYILIPWLNVVPAENV